MEEEKATGGIGESYDYVERAAQAVVDRQRYFDAILNRETKNIMSEIVRR